MLLENEPVPQLLHEAFVRKQEAFGKGYYVLELECPELAKTIDVGQFIQVRINQELIPFLRRPFSVFDVFLDEKSRPYQGISILYHIVGKGTELLSHYESGQSLSLHGPLGKTFPLPEDPRAPILMVGGGIGLAPFLWQIKKGLRDFSNRPYTLIAGGRSNHDLNYMRHFHGLQDQGLKLMLCTEDGSSGFKGRVTDLLHPELKAFQNQTHKPVLYCCGPTAMMHAVANLSKEFSYPCFASLETIMACGFGVCNGCVVPIHDSQMDAGYRYEKTCTKGPAFKTEELVWGSF